MVRSLLKEINQINGVEGVYMASNRSEIIDKTGLVYTDAQLSELVTYILRMIAAFHLKGKKITELELYWQNQYIICKSSEHFLIITFCKTSRILAFIRITLNVTMAKLLEDKKFSKWLKSHKADRDFVLKTGRLSDPEKKLLSYLK